MQKGRAEILNCLIASGMTIDEVADRLGLTVDEVLKLTGSSH
jgi:DNA-binding CsgD family transcriptional regulator